jgi:esterase/lipase superfamily enzyme
VSGLFRYARGIVASLTLAAVGFSARYLQHWMFPSVENLQPSAAVMPLNAPVLNPAAASPLRTVVRSGNVSWKIGVVTNRMNEQADRAETPAAAITPSLSGDTPRLITQLADAIYAMQQTTYAFADVNIPLNRARGHCDLKEPSGQSAVQIGSPESAQAFLESVQQSLSEVPTKNILVFVHGFNVSLEAAVARAAQLAEDMPFDGLVLAFSWQSQARTQAYLTDEKSAERHFWALAELLASMRRKLGTDCRLHVLAHSMGNRVTLRALNALAGTLAPNGADVDPFLRHRSSQPIKSFHGVLDGSDQIPERFPDWGSWQPALISQSPPLESLILAAPDVDAAEFVGFVNNVRHVSRRIVVYASDSDLALDASRKLHGGYRAGDSRARLNLQGVRVVNVSGVSAKDPLGHSYYGSNSRVLDQLHWLTRPHIDTATRIGDSPRLR